MKKENGDLMTWEVRKFSIKWHV